MNSTLQKGEIAFLKVLLRAAEKGITVSKPTTEVRYDLVVDVCGKLFRAQIKWGGQLSRNATGSVIIDLRKDGKLGIKKRCYEQEEVDVLLVYVPQVDKVLWVNGDQFHGRSTLTFRYERAVKMSDSVRMIDDFLW